MGTSAVARELDMSCSQPAPSLMVGLRVIAGAHDRGSIATWLVSRRRRISSSPRGEPHAGPCYRIDVRARNVESYLLHVVPLCDKQL